MKFILNLVTILVATFVATFLCRRTSWNGRPITIKLIPISYEAVVVAKFCLRMFDKKTGIRHRVRRVIYAIKIITEFGKNVSIVFRASDRENNTNKLLYEGEYYRPFLDKKTKKYGRKICIPALYNGTGVKVEPLETTTLPPKYAELLEKCRGIYPYE
ncbi:Hypothetical protein SRAE_2000436300 [Strongyloides ratti]|uniref:Uncharacterized protein n=1 Tax=Strongyloides ratti TaxID=34506 RepID=A0A090LQ99_STRRB|nr:Hypothetical protein SRAE_2000436300 [Strongyloides ratti]CEF69716.1 Hypothetical protein SRAE_2000436300 [Strongyloides ratti]